MPRALDAGGALREMSTYCDDALLPSELDDETGELLCAVLTAPTATEPDWPLARPRRLHPYRESGEETTAR